MAPKLIGVLLLAAALGWGQSAVDTQKLQDAKTKGFSMPVDVAASGNVSVEAVLLPARIAKPLFGKEIAAQYAIIELIVSNGNPDAAFIVHSISIDYSDWLLSGTPHALADAGLTAHGEAPRGDDQRANQVASVEYRIARGEALDAQAWTARNWSMRTLQFLGVIATGSEFAFKEVGIVKGIGAFAGQLVPAAQVLWPDRGTAQLDRISDFGFRANKVISKEASDIIVGFFPIDRFITPGLKKIFLESPAVFFVPAGALVDKTVRVDILRVLQRLLGANQVKLNESVETLLANSKISGLLDAISLNRVHVKVAGILSVDVENAPARIDSVTLDDPAGRWDGTSQITGVLQGALLLHGQPLITEAKQYGIAVAALPDRSNSEQLRFTVTLSKSVPPGTVLHFHVTKTKSAKTMDSNQVEITIPGASK